MMNTLSSNKSCGTLTSWDTTDTFATFNDDDDDEYIEEIIEKDDPEVTYFKDMTYQSKEMEHFIKVEEPYSREKTHHPDYHAENLFPSWILSNYSWKETVPSNKANKISELVRMSWGERTNEQNSVLIHWLMSVWPTANQMGYKKCSLMWRGFSHLQYKPNQDIIVEGERGLTFYIIASGEAMVIKEGIGCVATLKMGHTFGELALTSGNDYRSATVRAKTHLEALQLHKVDYDRFVKDIQDAERRENFYVLKNCMLFRNWTKAKIQKLCNACTRKSFNAGQYIFQQGDPCDMIYFVLDGKIDVYKEVVVVVRNRWPSSSGRGQEGISRKKKKPFKVSTLTKGDYFGEQAIVQNQLRTVSCVTSTACTVLSLDRLEFAHYIESDVAIQVMKNAYDDYVQDKQLLNSMIMNLKIRGGPSTTAQLNKCLEVVDEHRNGSNPSLDKTKRQISSGKSTARSSDGRGRRKTTQRSRPNTTESNTSDSSSRSRANGRSFLPPTPTNVNSIQRTTTLPIESFFCSPSVTEKKDGLISETMEENDEFSLTGGPIEAKHLHALKSKHFQHGKKMNAAKSFAQQLSKTATLRSELEKTRNRPAQFDINDDFDHETDANQERSTSAPQLSGHEKDVYNDEDIVLKRMAESVVEINREKEEPRVNYLQGGPLTFQKLRPSSSPNKILSFGKCQGQTVSKGLVLRAASNLQQPKSNPKVKVKEKYLPTMGSIKSVKLKSASGRRRVSSEMDDISDFVSTCSKNKGKV